jgi:hypothetical protein
MLNVSVGDLVIRKIMGKNGTRMKVSSITQNRVFCNCPNVGELEFDLETGAEINSDLGWDADYSCSYLILPKTF